MRDAFHEQLQHIVDVLVEMSARIDVAVADATRALLEADVETAEQVIAADVEIDRLQGRVEEQIFEQIARQQPVAGDLRVLVVALRMVADLERMGDLAQHVAKVARLRYPDHAIPAELRPTIEEMASAARAMTAGFGKIMQERDATKAEALMSADDHMDRLRRSLFHTILAPDWNHGVEAAVDIALLGRYYERIADHAVSMARRVIYLVTGEYPQEDTVLSP